MLSKSKLRAPVVCHFYPNGILESAGQFWEKDLLALPDSLLNCLGWSSLDGAWPQERDSFKPLALVTGVHGFLYPCKEDRRLP